MFRSVIAVIVMVIASLIGLFIGTALNNVMGGMILCALISGIACIVYSINNSSD